MTERIFGINLCGSMGIRQRSYLHVLMALSLLAGGLAGCQQGRATSQPVTLTVFAATSLSDAFQELGQAFEAQHPEAEVIFNFAGSHQLVQQLSEGAPADVFASADEAQMQHAGESGRIEPEEVRSFTGNRLVVILAPGNPGQIGSLQDLGKPGLRLVLAAGAVPAGQYTQDFLHNAQGDPSLGPAYPAGVLANVVSYEDSVRAVLSKVNLGEADAGIVYASDLHQALATAGEATPTWLEIPAGLNILARYPIAAVQDSRQPELAAAFVNFVLSEAGQYVLQSHGFLALESLP